MAAVERLAIDVGMWRAEEEGEEEEEGMRGGGVVVWAGTVRCEREVFWEGEGD